MGRRFFRCARCQRRATLSMSSSWASSHDAGVVGALAMRANRGATSRLASSPVSGLCLTNNCSAPRSAAAGVAGSLRRQARAPLTPSTLIRPLPHPRPTGSKQIPFLRHRQFAARTVVHAAAREQRFARLSSMVPSSSDAELSRRSSASHRAHQGGFRGELTIRKRAA